MFSEFFKLGVGHIFALDGLDHILFLLVMVIVYQLSEWKKVVLLATAFTIGHSITLVLSSLGWISVSEKPIEILIALSIGITAIINLVTKEQTNHSPKMRYVLAAVFGIVHGLGFSNTISAFMTPEEIFIPLLAMNIGVELAQIAVVLATLFLSYLLTDILKIKSKYLVITISIAVLLWSIVLVIQRL